MPRKKKEPKYWVVWSGDFSCEDVDMQTAKEVAVQDASCIDKNIETVYICQIVKKVKRVVVITDVK